MNRNEKKNGKNRIIKKIFFTSSAAVISITAALLLAGSIMQGMTTVWESGTEGGGKEPGTAAEDGISAEDGTAAGQEEGTSGVPAENGSFAGGKSSKQDGPAGKRRLDTSYHPQESRSGQEDLTGLDETNAGDGIQEYQWDVNGSLQESRTDSGTAAQDGRNQEEQDQDSQNQDNEGRDGKDTNGGSGTEENTQSENYDNPGEEQQLTAADRKMIQDMTLEEKAAQLFVLTPEALTGVQRVVQAGSTTKKAVNDYPVGGLVYFRENINSEEQFVKMVRDIQKYGRKRSGLPFFICVDEEGGSVARISGRGFPDVPEFPDMYEIGEQEDGAAAYDTGKQIGKYLARFQVNVDFAPVADVYSNEKNQVVGKRAFGKDPDLAAKMAANEVYGLKSQNIASVLKHFPGHGDTEEDSHSERACSYKTLDQLRDCELIPFRAGIQAGADFVMAGHISLPNILDDQTPASLSYKMITEVLRGELDFNGIVITDALNMGAITQHYDSAQAAVQAVSAGADMLLMPQDFKAAYEGLLQAVRRGKIRESRLDESLERIIKVKKVLS